MYYWHVVYYTPCTTDTLCTTRHVLLTRYVLHAMYYWHVMYYTPCTTDTVRPQLYWQPLKSRRWTTTIMERWSSLSSNFIPHPHPHPLPLPPARSTPATDAPRWQSYLPSSRMPEDRLPAGQNGWLRLPSDHHRRVPGVAGAAAGKADILLQGQLCILTQSYFGIRSTPCFQKCRWHEAVTAKHTCTLCSMWLRRDQWSDTVNWCRIGRCHRERAAPRRQQFHVAPAM